MKIRKGNRKSCELSFDDDEAKLVKTVDIALGEYQRVNDRKNKRDEPRVQLP